MRHQQNRASLFFNRLFQIFPAFFDKLNIFFVQPDKPVDVNIGKVMKLLPGAVKMIEKKILGKQRPVKFQAFRHARRKKKKISGGDKPGKYAKKPQPQPPGKIKQYFIRQFFHKSTSCHRKACLGRRGDLSISFVITQLDWVIQLFFVFWIPASVT